MARPVEELILRDLLATMPDEMYVPEDGSAVYLSIEDEFDTVVKITGPDFTNMTDDDIAEYVFKMFKKGQFL